MADSGDSRRGAKGPGKGPGGKGNKGKFSQDKRRNDAAGDPGPDGQQTDGSGVMNSNGKRPAAPVLTAKERKKNRQHMHVKNEKLLETFKQAEKAAFADAEKSSSAPTGPTADPASSHARPTEVQRPPLPTELTPRTISVVEFAEARAFEIRAMEKALSKATQHAGMARVFQTVPRHMRRRAASHNPKRLPKRLRERAIEQMTKDPGGPPRAKKRKALLSRRRRRRALGDFVRRQRSKRWLETHIWHAKRMKMADLWGFRIAECANDKALRATYRAARQQCVAHDSSFIEVIEVIGSETSLKHLFEHCTDPTLPAVASKRFLSGSRWGTTAIYEGGMYPRHFVAPVEFLWRQTEPDAGADVERHIWIWVHPAVYDHVEHILQQVVAKADDFKGIQINRLQRALSRFELIGPRAQAILTHILKTTTSETTSETAVDVEEAQPMETNDSATHSTASTNPSATPLWTKLSKLRSPGSLPPHTVLGLTVYDHRLSFPPKIPPRTLSSDEADSQIQHIITNWPENVARSDIWDHSVRDRCRARKPTEKEMNKRRSTALIPGTPLVPIKDDVRIPILLLQQPNADGSGSYSIITPSGFGMDLWKNLIFGGARAIGLRDLRNLRFEMGVRSWPWDCAESSLWECLEANAARQRIARWKRTPKGKRYETLPDWETLTWKSLGLDPRDFSSSTEAEDTNTQPVPPPACAEKAPSDAVNGVEPMEVTIPPAPMTPATVASDACQSRKRDITIPESPFATNMVVSSPRVVALIRAALSAPVCDRADFWSNVFEKWRRLVAKRALEFPNLSIESVQECFVPMKLTALSSGTVHSQSLVYRLPDPSHTDYHLYRQVVSLALSRSCGSIDQTEAKLDCFPPDDFIVGYVTTGGFSINLGKGSGVCVVRLRGLLEQTQDEINAQERMVLVRTPRGRRCFAARAQFIE
ncbi:ribonucleases P/MRP protein subunit POP1-domain-containing protein [Gaertneriomyces semiglobifer]|nr:ribonucleases P/MRP protein subunit POP1-domain-containing protein [Gaertneriomyces semiglobifer]